MPDWDMNGETTKAGYEAQIAALREEVARLNGDLEFADITIGKMNKREDLQAALKENATLSARLAKASKALQPFATKAELWLSSVPDHETLWITLGIAGMEEKDEQITLGDLRRAAAWVKEIEDGN